MTWNLWLTNEGCYRYKGARQSKTIKQSVPGPFEETLYNPPNICCLLFKPLPHEAHLHNKYSTLHTFEQVADTLRVKRSYQCRHHCPQLLSHSQPNQVSFRILGPDWLISGQIHFQLSWGTWLADIKPRSWKCPHFSLWTGWLLNQSHHNCHWNHHYHHQNFFGHTHKTTFLTSKKEDQVARNGGKGGGRI